MIPSDASRSHSSRRFQTWGLALALALFAILLGLAVRASGEVTRVDGALTAAAWRLRQPWLDETMMALSGFGDGLPRWCVTALASAYLLATRRYRWALALIAAMVACALLGPGLKLAFHTPRPSPLYTGADAFSFPSGHAIAAAALYTILGVVAAEGLAKPWARLALGLAAIMVVAISLSRVYLGAHWFSDVLAGVALGTALAIVAITMARAGKTGPGPADWRTSAAILVCIGVVAAATGSTTLAKAHRLYAPFLSTSRWTPLPAQRPGLESALHPGRPRAR